MLAPDGRCKTLDAAADGYVRAEACGALVLSAMSLEQAAEDRVGQASRALALIASSSVNQVRIGRLLWFVALAWTLLVHELLRGRQGYVRTEVAGSPPLMALSASSNVSQAGSGANQRIVTSLVTGLHLLIVALWTTLSRDLGRWI